MDSNLVVPQGTDVTVAKKRAELPSRLPSLDGWRALSICLVLGEHSLFTFDIPDRSAVFIQKFFDGNLGVRFFFVISGFLITYLLLKEHQETGLISLRNFYVRRALRILPVYYTFLAVVFILQLITPWKQPGITWIANLTFTTNYFPINWTTGHLWSLAVEEQFYLMWPMLLCLAGPGKFRRVLSVLCVPVILAPIFRWMGFEKMVPSALKFLFHSYSFIFQFDSLAIGCIGAALFVHYRKEISAVLTRFRITGLIVGALLVLVPEVLSTSWVSVYVNETFNATLPNTIQAIGLCILLLQSVILPRQYKEFNWKPVAQIGVLSYSIYIWQSIFSNNPARFGLSTPWFMSFYYWWFAVLLASLCSYYLLEKPVMGLRRHFRSGTPKIAS